MEFPSARRMADRLHDRAEEQVEALEMADIRRCAYEQRQQRLPVLRRCPEQDSPRVLTGGVISHMFIGDTVSSPAVAHHILRAGAIEIANNREGGPATLIQRPGLS